MKPRNVENRKAEGLPSDTDITKTKPTTRGATSSSTVAPARCQESKLVIAAPSQRMLTKKTANNESIAATNGTLLLHERNSFTMLLKASFQDPLLPSAPIAKSAKNARTPAGSR